MKENLVSTLNICHCTKSLNSLISILESKSFWPNYCEPEEIDFLNWEKVVGQEVDSNLKLSFPMICFTDLSPFLRENHKARYGQYLIELTEEWKLHSNLQPVWYLNGTATDNPNDNHVCNTFLPQTLGFALRGMKEFDAKNSYKTHYQNFLDLLLPYFKIYRSKKDGTIYYDEREWRFIPSDLEGKSLCLIQEEYLNPQKREEAVKSIRSSNNNKLFFEFKDLCKIEVTTYEEKKRIITVLMKTFSVSFQEANDIIFVPKSQ